MPKIRPWINEFVNLYRKIQRNPKMTIGDLDEANTIVSKGIDKLQQIIDNREGKKRRE